MLRGDKMGAMLTNAQKSTSPEPVGRFFRKLGI